MKKVHIVVHEGLIQDVFVDSYLDIEVVIHDLDNDNEEELVETKAFVKQLPDIAHQIY